jgi:hypothetical protein
MSAEAVDKGIWAELIVDGKEIGRIRVRSSDPDINPEYRNALSVAAIAAISATGDQLDKIKETTALAVIAETILTDWELYKADKNGVDKPIKFSPKKAVELMEKLPKLRAAIERAAMNWTRFRRHNIDEAVKT